MFRRKQRLITGWCVSTTINSLYANDIFGPVWSYLLFIFREIQAQLLANREFKIASYFSRANPIRIVTFYKRSSIFNLYFLCFCKYTINGKGTKWNPLELVTLLWPLCLLLATLFPPGGGGLVHWLVFMVFMCIQTWEPPLVFFFSVWRGQVNSRKENHQRRPQSGS